jgi:predicted nucleotidyltransferase
MKPHYNLDGDYDIDIGDILMQQFPALVQHLILFGSKAMGTATADSDLDLLVVAG